MRTGAFEVGHRLVVEPRRSFVRGMALLALISELALVWIVVAMAVYTVDLAGLVVALRMTLGARDFRVRALERKLGEGIMIKLDSGELDVRLVTALTLLSELTFV